MITIVVALDDEVWLPVDSNRVKPLYFISNYGNVVNIKGKLIKPFVDKDGYLRYTLQGYTKKVKFYAHRLVAMHFIPCENIKHMQINHINGKKDFNYYQNLEWVTPKENIMHSYMNNLQVIHTGVEYKESRDNDKLVEEICKLLEQGLTSAKIRKKLNLVSENLSKNRKYIQLIKRVRQRVYYKYISDNYKF